MVVVCTCQCLYYTGAIVYLAEPSAFLCLYSLWSIVTLCSPHTVYAVKQTVDALDTSAMLLYHQPIPYLLFLESFCCSKVKLAVRQDRTRGTVCCQTLLGVQMLQSKCAVSRITQFQTAPGTTRTTVTDIVS